MRRAFGDSFLFIALLNPRDCFHQRAVEITRDWEGQIITTRWVLAEVGNALCGVKARHPRIPCPPRCQFNFSMSACQRFSDSTLAKLDLICHEDILAR